MKKSELRKLIKEELLKEAIVVTGKHAIKYFKLIQKTIGAKKYEVKKINDSQSYVKYDNGLVLLLKDEGKKSFDVVGFNNIGSIEEFQSVPTSVKTFKDVKKMMNLPSKNLKKPSSVKATNVLNPIEDIAKVENKKYILTSEKSGKLSRIKAVKSFGSIKEGDLGG